MILDVFLPIDRFFGGFGTYALWAVGNLIIGALVIAVAVVCALIVRGIRFLIKRLPHGR